MSAVSSAIRTDATRQRHRWRSRAVIAGVVAMLISLIPSTGVTSATAATSTASWLASQVGVDGSVIDPYGTEPSVDWTVNVALSLLATADQPEALDRAVGYVEANADTYVTDGTSDQAGHLSWLILLATFTGHDPRSFGAGSLDLVSLLQDRLGVAEDGLFGVVDDYTPVTNQSLSIIALTAAGVPVPAMAVTWLRAQQCDAPAEQAGGWQGHRSELSPGVLEPCEPVSSAAYTRADAASTSFALQALAAIGSVDDPAILSGLAWLHRLQSAATPAPGGFGQYIGDPSDPNSTALVIQALRATDSLDSGWILGGGDPASSLASWVIDSGLDAGAMASPYSSGAADLFATYQGIWGIEQRALPTHLFVPATGPTIEDPSVVGDPGAVQTPSFTG